MNSLSVINRIADMKTIGLDATVNEISYITFFD